MGTEKRERQKAGRDARREALEAERRKAQKRRSYMGFAAIAVGVVVVAALISILGGSDDDEVSTADDAAETAEPGQDTAETAEPDDGEAAEPLPCPPVDGVDEPVTSFPAPPPDCLTEGADYAAVFTTSAGEITVDLLEGELPGTVNNFVYLARYGYYDGSLLFRTDPSIDIIQGGGPTTNSPSDPGPGYTIPDEGGPFAYEPGDLVMARSAAPDSSGAQFFFAAGPDVALLNDQGTYLLFGETTEGLDVLEEILASHVDEPDNPLGGAPDPEVTVESVTIVES
ncbi:MAG TPA: peptidylprolyl isomerase [Acidimicrobiales bacterium]|nr:peptidylprolyl isomerase [Acidimicrobiales bacterium]